MFMKYTPWYALQSTKTMAASPPEQGTASDKSL